MKPKPLLSRIRDTWGGMPGYGSTPEYNTSEYWDNQGAPFRKGPDKKVKELEDTIAEKFLAVKKRAREQELRIQKMEAEYHALVKFADAELAALARVEHGMKLVSGGEACRLIGGMLCGSENCRCAERFMRAWNEVIHDSDQRCPWNVDLEAWNAAREELENVDYPDLQDTIKEAEDGTA